MIDFRAWTGDPKDSGTLAELLAAAVRAIAGADGLPSAAQVVADLAVLHFDADLAGVTEFARHGGRRRLASTDDRFLAIDGALDGPTGSPLTAPLAEGALVAVPDLTADPRWPEWSAAVVAQGPRSALLLGLPPVQGHAVTLELYGHRLSATVTSGASPIAHFATHAGLAMEQAAHRWNLEESLLSRGMIGQAQGILMARYELTGPQAMSFLRRQSQHSQTRIRDLAASIVSEHEAETTGSEGSHDDVG